MIMTLSSVNVINRGSMETGHTSVECRLCMAQGSMETGHTSASVVCAWHDEVWSTEFQLKLLNV